MLRSSRAFAILTLSAAGFALAACSSGGSSGPDLAPVAPAEPAVTLQPVAPLPTGPMKAADITRAFAERKFSYSSAGRKGTVTYFKDGTFEYDEAGKGLGTGIWQAADGKLCEARNPTSFLPKGTPSTCSKITSDGTRFTVGAMQLIPI
jgi:hypothetical protein